jgi:hypothetical protein
MRRCFGESIQEQVFDLSNLGSAPRRQLPLGQVELMTNMINKENK